MRRYLLFLTVILLLPAIPVDLCFGQDPLEVGELLSKVNRREHNTDLVTNLLNQASDYRGRSFDTSMLLSTIAYEISRDIKFGYGVADAYYKKSLTYKAYGDYNQALK